MSAETIDHTDPEAALAEALAAFQAEMPHVGKGNSANAGTYQYSYADLADITKTVLPVMARHGLSFSAKPTLNGDGKFVLQYTLRHAKGGRDVGEYPLPTTGTPQQIGSAISYARRYCFSAVTGVAPDEDDDGRAAAETPTDYSRPPRQRSQQSRNGAQNGHQGGSNGQRTSQPPADEPALSGADQARDVLVKKIAVNKWDGGKVAAEFARRYGGADIRTETNAPRIEAFTKLLDDVPADQLRAAATNGAAQ